jgi:hypothetical protein
MTRPNDSHGLDSLIREKFSYDQETGLIRRVGGRCDGMVTGEPTPKGYLKIEISFPGGNKKIFAHRMAWFLHHGGWPEESIDHIDRCKTNNRIENLRVVSNKMNAQNRLRDSMGVTERCGRFRARIWCPTDQRRISLGTFDSRPQAENAFIQAKLKLHPGFMLSAQ